MSSDSAPAPAEPGSPRSHLAWTLIVLGAVAAAVVWLAMADERPAPVESAADAAALAIAGPTSFAEVEPVPEPEAPVRAALGADDEIQLCGGHWVRAGLDGKPDGEALQAIVATALDEVSGDALGLMAASPSPRVQAAAHYYRIGAAAAAAAGSGDGRPEAAAHRDALARLAQTTDDAQVYAWAWRACRSAPEASPGACMQVGAAQWTRIDPDNAEAWLAAADEARRRKDDAALDDAMFHVAAAERHDPGRAVLAAAVAEYTPHDERSLLGSYLAIAQAVRLEGAASGDLQGVLEYCSSAATAEANRRETCERVAGLLADRSSSVAARNAGIGLGKRLGWTEERIEALSQQRDAEATAARMEGAGAGPVDPMACAAMRAAIDRVRADAEFGEVEMLRRDVSATGQPIGKLAAEARRRREREPRPVGEDGDVPAAAASAASPASASVVARR